MPITRRQFLTRGGLVTAGAALAPGLFSNLFARPALAETIGDRYLVLLFLDGGNDGFNTVVPYDDGTLGGMLRTHYEGARHSGAGGLRIPASQLLRAASPMIDAHTGTELGLHPGLTGLMSLYDQGKVALIQGCGYPEYSLSHDESRVIWETGNPGPAALTGGWAGRHLALEYGQNDIPAITIAGGIAAEFHQAVTGVLAIRRFEGYGFPYDDYDVADRIAQRDAFRELYQLASANAQSAVRFLGDGGQSTLTSTESYALIHSLYAGDPARQAFSAQYDLIDRSTARDLREVAKVVNAVRQGVPGVAARFFQLSNGGYDTHSDQGAGETDGQHYDLLAEVGNSLEVFYADLEDMGVANKVCTMVWSEFSRRIPQNENGTDHGSQGPVFVIGGAVNGGVYGNHPNVDPAALNGDENTRYSQDPGDAFRSTDFRDVYGTLLKHWLNVPEALILSSLLALDAGPPHDYWTVPDFDLGFLP
jgi:uncharacterized protein (DUF1501 family)